jgi:hypothetical protein
MAKKDIHVVPFQGNWAVKKEGVKTPVSIHYKKANAEEKAIQLGKKAKVEVVYHGKDGRIQDSDSYGNDPNPPKDKKY